MDLTLVNRDAHWADYTKPNSRKAYPKDLSVAISAFTLLFLAELGDKTQLAMIALVAGTAEIWSVFAGGTLALWTVSLIGILFGAALLRKIPKHRVHRAEVQLFVTFRVLALGQVVLNGGGLRSGRLQLDQGGQGCSSCFAVGW